MGSLLPRTLRFDCQPASGVGLIPALKITMLKSPQLFPTNGGAFLIAMGRTDTRIFSSTPQTGGLHSRSRKTFSGRSGRYGGHAPTSFRQGSCMGSVPVGDRPTALRSWTKLRYLAPAQCSATGSEAQSGGVRRNTSSTPLRLPEPEIHRARSPWRSLQAAGTADM